MLLHLFFCSSLRSGHLKTSANIILLIALLYVPFRTQLHAQATAILTGRVVSAENQLPVEGVRIILQSARDRKPLQTQTDSDGVFRFKAIPAGEVSLTLKGKGLVSKRLTVSLTPNQLLSLPVTISRIMGPSEKIKVVDSSARLNPRQSKVKMILTRQDLDEMPTTLTGTLQSLIENTIPSAIVSHDTIIHLRGQETPMLIVINGVSFLDNPDQHFSQTLSPRVFQSVNFLSSGFSAEYGNRFGGILDINTRSGYELDGHGSLSTGIGTQLNHNASFEYGDRVGKLGYYFFLSAFESGRFMNPPTKREIHDLGRVGQSVFQLDYQTNKDLIRLFISTGGSNFELPNTAEEAAKGRDSSRRIRSETAIFTWQHTFAPKLLVSSSLYQRIISDRFLPTSDLETPFSEGARSTLTLGVKNDLGWIRGDHHFKTGLDVKFFRLREAFLFDSRSEEHGEEHGEEHEKALLNGLPQAAFTDPGEHQHKLGHPVPSNFLTFSGRDLGGQISLYVQDQFQLAPNLMINAGVRWDQFHLVSSESQVSPRLNLSYALPPHRTLLHFSYDRLFIPPPIEFIMLSGYLGFKATEKLHEEGDLNILSGNTRSTSRHFFEAGWTRLLKKRLTLTINAYHHRSKNPVENAEFSNSKLFLPANFAEARASGVEWGLSFNNSDPKGISTQLHYAAAKVHFFGPISGGALVGEHFEDGERVTPAFDQRHTASGSVLYKTPWRHFRTGVFFRYGSGTPLHEHFEFNGIEMERIRWLDQNFTADVFAGLTLWKNDPQRLGLEFNISNLGNNIYPISKESKETPIQFSPRRTFLAKLTWDF